MPLDLVARGLEHHGALVEREDAAALQAVLPPGLSRALDLPEAPLLARDGRAGGVPCGHGTGALRAVIEHLTGRRAGAGREPGADDPSAVVGHARAEVTPPRPGAPDAYTGLNVSLRPERPTPAEAWTVIAQWRAEAVADDRSLLRVESAASLEDGCAIDLPGWTSSPLRPLAGADAPRPPASLLAAAEGVLRRRAEAAALAGLAEFRAGVARRARRDVLRVDRYFAELDRDLVARARRGRGRNHEALAAKRALLPAERARRLQTLAENYAVRLRLDPVAVLALQVPVASARLEVRRKRGRRTVRVRYHPLVHAWLPLTCEGCAAATRAIGACDAEVHLLCAECLAGGGHKRCPRCARGGPPPPPPPAALPARLEPADAPDLPPGSPLLQEVQTPAASPPRPAAPRARAPSGSEGSGPRSPDAPAEPPAEAPPERGPADRAAAAPATPAAPVAPAAEGADDTALVELLRAAGRPLSSEELQRRTGRTALQLRPALRRLVAAGRVERTGRARGTRYGWRG